MEWTKIHGRLLAEATVRLLGSSQPGAMAFIRCLTPDVVRALAEDPLFAPSGWQVLRVAGKEHLEEKRTISADRAVELREEKGDAVLLLVDTESAGAGMDGIYSATREVDEVALFQEAVQLAGHEIKQRFSSVCQQYAEQAMKKVRRYRGRNALSPWTEFDFLCRVAAGERSPGAYLHLLGLWPIVDPENLSFVPTDDLDTSRMFVDRLLGVYGARNSLAARIEAVRIDPNSKTKTSVLESFLHSADTKSLRAALEELAKTEDLWIGNLRTEPPAQSIQGINLTPWRIRNGAIAKWSGLREDGSSSDLPVLFLKSDDDPDGDSSTTLEVRWKAEPPHLEKSSVDYLISVQTDQDQDEPLAELQVSHSARKGGEKARFTDDSFRSLEESALLSAKVTVEVVGDTKIERQESEEFIIRFGEPPKQETAGVGKKVRTLSEGLAEFGKNFSRKDVPEIMLPPVSSISVDPKNFVSLRTRAEHGTRKSFRVFRPSLIAKAEKQWIEREGEVGRWIVKVRDSGEHSTKRLEFEPSKGDKSEKWERTRKASRALAKRFAHIGGVGQIYDEADKGFSIIREYLRSWITLLEDGDSLLTLANTVEVQSLSGRTIGLIVLPSHPLRVAWHASYDNLVLYAAFEQNESPKRIREELASLDGAMFPAFLPNPNSNGGTFVFADTLGFHSVGMVPDEDKEPKAAIAILARALEDGNVVDSAPTVGIQSAKVLTNEIVKYLDCHDTSRLLHIHALRAGDGLTVARSLGGVHDHYQQDEENANQDGEKKGAIPERIFSLDFYPSGKQHGVAGRFIAEAREKHRSRAGVLVEDDRWMFDSLPLPAGMNAPRLRWARKERKEPDTPAHLAVAFDTFESRVVERCQSSGPYYVFGLLSFYERSYTSQPSPEWISAVPEASGGEKHPSSRAHTETLVRLQHVVQNAVVRYIGKGNGSPALKTEISPEKHDSLRKLHGLCDWVVTLDRNAGTEYFDSPKTNKEVYDAYVIDCVPEREDLGCLQLITSTANLEEVRNLLDYALDQMGLSRSRRNAEFLLGHLKALSGRLSIRLTGHRRITSELVALAVSHANCQYASEKDDCWISLENGFFVPVDDVRDLLLHFVSSKDENKKQTRPDLIHVSVDPRRGGRIVFRFVEVKYRRHLRTARSPDVLEQIDQQIGTFRHQWYQWYDDEDISSVFRAVRRAKLARVLRFYADKAHRHHLRTDRYHKLVNEINRMIEDGGNYTFSMIQGVDRGWVFCPEYTGPNPLKISPDDCNAQIFLFGPRLLPDSNFDSEENSVQQTDRAIKVYSTKSLDDPEDESASQQMDDVLQSSNASSFDQNDFVPTVSLGINSYTNAEIEWRLGVDGNPHLLIAGLPGMGKTTCLVNLCKQMVAQGVRPIVFSYHQDIDERLEKLIGDIRYVDFDGLGFNPLQVIDRNARMAYLDVAGAVRDIFTAIYPDLGDIQAESIRRAIKESFDEAGWSSREDVLEPEFKRFVEILRTCGKPDRGLHSLFARLDELDDYGFFDAGDESRGSLWEGEKPIIIRIHTTQNDNLQRAFAYLIFYGLYKDMFRRGIRERITHALVFDEAHRATRLKLIPTMAKECRKYGISLVLASQEARDFDVSVFSAIANYLIFRSTDADAKFLVRNVANSKQEKVLIDRIKQMEKYKAFYFGESKSQPSHLTLPPVD